MPEIALSTAAPSRPSPRPIVLYFVGAFVITWGFQLPGVLAQRGFLPGNPESYMALVVFGIFGPTLAAMLVMGMEDGWAGVKALFRPIKIWRVSPFWYFAALCLQGLLLAGGLAVYQLVTGNEIRWFYFPDKQRAMAMVIISFAEEVGWRGFAQPRLQKLYHPIVATTILSVLWTFWHIPMFLGAEKDMTLQALMLGRMPLMLAMFVPGTLIYTWIYNRTGGSLLLAILTHAGSHLNNSTLTLPGDARPLITQAVVFTLAAIVLVAVDRKTFRPN